MLVQGDEGTQSMICAFCGTDNRQENKFCGMCGVRLENRNSERRVAKSGASLTCPSCGHVNEPGHKFCGMCGTRVDRRAHDRRDIPEEERAGAMANVGLPTPEARGKRGQSRPAPAAAPAAAEVPAFRASEGIFRDDSPRPATIGGPSFLGLSDDSNTQGEYLLEDEGSSGSVLRKLVLLAILAAVGGLVFVQWRSNLGFFANAKLPEPPKIASSPPPPPQADHQEARQASPPDSSAPDDSAHRASSNTPAVGSKEEDHAQTPREGHGKTDGKTGEAASDLSPSPLLLRAQNYLLGKDGVKQNCEQGLVYLRAATKANEPAAAMQMGALYASGHCVAHDRVMAYRWFNSAHELEPDNQEIRSDLDHLWAQMTAHERRQVGR
jgi:hypothetical protein